MAALSQFMCRPLCSIGNASLRHCIARSRSTNGHELSHRTTDSSSDAPCAAAEGSARGRNSALSPPNRCLRDVSPPPGSPSRSSSSCWPKAKGPCGSATSCGTRPADGPCRAVRPGLPLTRAASRVGTATVRARLSSRRRPAAREGTIALDCRPDRHGRPVRVEDRRAPPPSRRFLPKKWSTRRSTSSVARWCSSCTWPGSKGHCDGDSSTERFRSFVDRFHDHGSRAALFPRISGARPV